MSYFICAWFSAPSAENRTQKGSRAPPGSQVNTSGSLDRRAREPTKGVGYEAVLHAHAGIVRRQAARGARCQARSWLGYIVIVIARADPNDAERLHAIAVAAKAHWGFDAAWMAEWARRVQITPEYLAGSLAFVAIEAGVIVGWYALLPRPPAALLDHLWLLPEQIGRGLGRQLFEHALGQARALGAERLELEAEPNAVGFYQHMGAVVIGSLVSEMGRAIPIMEIGL